MDLQAVTTLNDQSMSNASRLAAACSTELLLLSQRALGRMAARVGRSAGMGNGFRVCMTLLCVCVVATATTVWADEESSTASDASATDKAAGEDAEQDTPETPKVNPRVAFREDRPIEQWRYRVRLHLGFAPDSRMPAARQQRITAELMRVIDRSWGLLLEGDVDPENFEDLDDSIAIVQNPPHLIPANRLALERLDAESLQQQHDEAQVDKVILITVTPGPGRTTVAARIWDTRLRSLSDIHEFTVIDERLIAERMFEAMAGAFRPILVVH